MSSIPYMHNYIYFIHNYTCNYINTEKPKAV